ncbi:amidohydrolase family protein [Pleomorphochaeta sp. DL1XJH-081]|uniref:amidohydrolase family protein n=1 Tax=Pleomorphochaeta sp. DL1XJH-081 TaxID=3409690 RepID=UPI003BB4E63E
MNTTLIRDGLLVESDRSWRADLLIEGEKITRIAPRIDTKTLPDDTDIVEAEGLCVMPGLIDSHTHYHLVSRGTVTADSFIEGSKLAAFGGVTTVVDFADHDKKRPLVASTNDRIDAMEKEMAIDFALHQGVYGMHEGIGKELEELLKRGVSTIKIFTTYKNVGYLIGMEGLRDLFSLCKKNQIMISAHCEDDTLIEQVEKEHKGSYTPADHALLRPAEAEYRAIKYLGSLAGEFSMPLYVVHLSSSRGLDAVRELRSKGIQVVVETTPHYLLLDASRLEGPQGPLYVMTPPLRTHHDNRDIQDALIAKELQVVATDHCAFTRAQKLASDDCRTIFPGIPGTEELLPLVYTFAVASSRMSLSDLVGILSSTPARLFGLYPQKGSLQIGTDADIVLFDPEATWTLSSDTVHSASEYTPYEGFSVAGKAVMTFLRGHLIMGDDVYVGKPGEGKFLRAKTSSAYD